MNASWRCMVWLLAAFLSGCGDVNERVGAGTPRNEFRLFSSSSRHPGVPKSTAARVAFETIEIGWLGPFAAPGMFVFRSPEEWRSTLNRWCGDGSLMSCPPPPPPQAVNWHNEVVILVSAGVWSGGPGNVEIQEIRREGTIAWIDVCFKPPGGFGDWASPFHLIKLKTSGIQDYRLYFLRDCQIGGMDHADTSTR